MTPAEYIANAVKGACDVSQAVPHRPPRLEGRMAFVEPGEPWKEHDEAFCGTRYRLSVWLVAGATDPVGAMRWLDTSTDALMALGPIQLGDGGDTVIVEQIQPPALIQQDVTTTSSPTSSFYVCRVEFSPFVTGD